MTQLRRGTWHFKDGTYLFLQSPRTPIGRSLTSSVTRLLEYFKVAPTGTAETSQILNVAADSLVAAGELGIFTPSFLVHARKLS